MIWNVQPIVDAMLNLAGTGLPVFFRVDSVPDTDPEFEQLGLRGTVNSGPSGTFDILVLPQPRVKQLSMQSIGMTMGQLDETSKLFVVSHTFVAGFMAAYGLSDVETVFDGLQFKSLLGIVYENKLYDIAQYAHREVGGVTTSWRLTCKASR